MYLLHEVFHYERRVLMKKFLINFSLTFSLVVVSLAAAAEKPAAIQQKSPAAVVAQAKNSDPTNGMEFVFVKGGCFQMGDVFGDGGSDEKPVHEVCVSDFYLGKYEVTQGQWEKVMQANPSTRIDCGLDCPVESVSWEVVQEYIGKLNGLSGLQYRLPTEAEWEYAARSGGKKEKWAGTSDEKKLVDFAWFDKNSDSKAMKRGLKKPNGLGLYDMTGNVAEWCQDFYGETFYVASPKDNPVGPVTGDKRVLRGGGHYYSGMGSRTTSRMKDEPGIRDYSYGLRLVRSAK